MVGRYGIYWLTIMKNAENVKRILAHRLIAALLFTISCLGNTNAAADPRSDYEQAIRFYKTDQLGRAALLLEKIENEIGANPLICSFKFKIFFYQNRNRDALVELTRYKKLIGVQPIPEDIRKLEIELLGRYKTSDKFSRELREKKVLESSTKRDNKQKTKESKLKNGEAQALYIKIDHQQKVNGEMAFVNGKLLSLKRWLKENNVLLVLGGTHSELKAIEYAATQKGYKGIATFEFSDFELRPRVIGFDNAGYGETSGSIEYLSKIKLVYPVSNTEIANMILKFIPLSTAKFIDKLDSLDMIDVYFLELHGTCELVVRGLPGKTVSFYGVHLNTSKYYNNAGNTQMIANWYIPSIEGLLSRGKFIFLNHSSSWVMSKGDEIYRRVDCSNSEVKRVEISGSNAGKLYSNLTNPFFSLRSFNKKDYPRGVSYNKIRYFNGEKANTKETQNYRHYFSFTSFGEMNGEWIVKIDGKSAKRKNAYQSILYKNPDNGGILIASNVHFFWRLRNYENVRYEYHKVELLYGFSRWKK